MTASTLIAAPDSTSGMRAAAGIANVVDSAKGDVAAQINAITISAKGKVCFAAGTYSGLSPILRRTGLEYEGEGEDTCIEARSGHVGTYLFFTPAGAHWTSIKGMRLEGRKRVENAVYCASGKPDAADPATSPDSWHRHSDLFVAGTNGPAFASTSGTDGTREGYFKDILVIGGGFDWSGSDVYIDNVELRNSPTPLKISGGSARIGTIKVFYSTGVGVQIASSRVMAGAIEVQDAGTHGIDIASVDAVISMLKVDSCGRLAAGDGVLVNGQRATLPNVVVIDRGANALRVRHGVVINQPSGLTLHAVVGSNISGSKWTGGTTGAYSIRVNGQWIVGGASGGTSAPPVDLTPVTDRLAALEQRASALEASMAGAVEVANAAHDVSGAVALAHGDLVAKLHQV